MIEKNLVGRVLSFFGAWFLFTEFVVFGVLVFYFLSYWIVKRYESSTTPVGVLERKRSSHRIGWCVPSKDPTFESCFGHN